MPKDQFSLFHKQVVVEHSGDAAEVFVRVLGDDIIQITWLLSDIKEHKEHREYSY